MIVKQSYTYKTTGDCEIQADVYRPTGDEIRPAILWLHGGALIFGDRTGIAADQLAKYLEAGYTLVSVDYRLAPEIKLPAIIEDLEDAYDWLRMQGPKLFQIDPHRIAVIGHSAGGYLALMAGFRVNPRPRAVVAFYGYGDIISPWYSRPDPFYNQQPTVSQEDAFQARREGVLTGSLSEQRWRFYLYCRQQGRWPLEVTGHDPDQEAIWFKPFCPLRNITKEYPPTLLLHGTADTDVPFEQSKLMADELAQQGVEYELVTLVNQGHGFDKAGVHDSEIGPTFDRVCAFLTEHLM